MSEDLFDVILAGGRTDPDRPAIRESRGHVTTWRELREGALGVAEDLHQHGVGVGDGVLLAIRPSARAVMSALGVAHAGAVAIVADPGAGQALVRARRVVAPARAAIADSVVYAATSSVGSQVHRRLPMMAGLQLPDLGDPDLHHIVSGPLLPGVPDGATPWQHLPLGRDRGPVAGAGKRDALVVFTSGSTAEPRAVVHTTRSLRAGIHCAATSLGLDRNTVMSTDQLMIGLPVLAAGGLWSLTPVTASARSWMAQARRDRASHLYAVPAKLVAAADVGVPATVRWLGAGGAPVLPEAVRRLERSVPGARIAAVYGMTEALPVAVATGRDVLDSPPGGVCAGRPVGAALVSVCDPGADGIGELVVTGAQMFDRYAGQAAAREVRTGDLGRVGEDGRILLCGRAKRMIIRGQANIYPDLVEPLLTALFTGRIEDVALVGRPDPVTGDEQVTLLVVASPGVDRAALARDILTAWPLVADEGWRPDRIVAVRAIARRGRSAAVDLEAL